MNFTSEEFQDSDEVWLAENVFSQLKDFSYPVINNTIDKSSNSGTQFTSLSSDIFESQITETKVISDALSDETKIENQPDLIQDITIQNNDAVHEDVKIETENNNQENIFMNEFIIPKNQNNNTKIEHSFDSPINLEESNLKYEKSLLPPEPQKYFELLMPFYDSSKTDEVLIINENCDNKDLQLRQSFTTKTTFVKCIKCLQIFEENSFNYHICDDDWIQSLTNLNISSNPELFPSSSLFHPSNKNLLECLCQQNRERLPKDPPCLRQLRENIAKIRKFVKDEIKIDLVDSSEKKIESPHECTLCERKFVHASGLGRHMEKHAMDLIPATNSNMYVKTNQLKVMIKCLVCGRLFFKTTDAMNHLFKNHQENKDLVENYKNISEENEYNNVLLSEEFINILIKIEDQKNYKSENNFEKEEYFDVIIVSDVLQCEFCEFIFSDCSHLLLHSACHDPNMGFQCISCEIQVPTSKEIFLHWQAECVFARELVRENFIIKRFYTCNVCENKFSSLEQLTDHRYTAMHFFPRRRDGIKNLQIGCEYCGCIFDKIAHLVNHREEKHLKKLIEKKGINIVQGNNFGVNGQKFRQYLCDICGKSYTQSSHLWQHLRFHRGVKPFACQEPNCDRTFTIRPDLNDHIRKCHTGERPYQCQVCGKRFLTGSVYYQHRLIHRGDRRYACEECGKRFYRADALKNHQRIHTGEKPYSCLYCTKNFRQRGDCDKHIRARHSNLDENAKNVLTALKKGQMQQLTTSTGFGRAIDEINNLSFPQDIYP